ncbi:MAG: hemerythrin domain-containing protein [Pseudomonadota bacterium]
MIDRSSVESQAPAALTAGRHDVYGLIHKGLRAFMLETLARLGRVDVEAAASFSGAVGQARALLGKLSEHLLHENTFLHSALEARAPGGSAATAIEHADHEKAFRELGLLLDACERAFDQGRRAELESATKQLYLSLSFFVAENLAHMYREETETTKLLWRLYSDDELRSIEGAIVASESPEQLAVGMRWMLPSLTPRERAGLLGGARQGLPPAAFQGLMALAQSVLGADEYRQLVNALG